MLGVIMNHVAGHQVLREAPDVLVAYLGVLHSLAVTEYGARSMFNQLQVNRKLITIFSVSVDGLL